MSAGLAAAMVLDAIFGEPDWLWKRAPHPAVIMGRAVGWLDARLNRGAQARAMGVLAIGLLIMGAGGLGIVLAEVSGLFEIIGAAILLAHRSLLDHVRAVSNGLRTSLADGRAAVAMIVGRDVAPLDRAGVARAAIESGAENFSDGVVAPAFWFLVAGLPGILIYKIVNTADSMIGYRTPRHEAFGWAAARLDDVLNWVPARVTAALIAGVHGRLFDRTYWAQVVRDARRHRSPNAGWPEAALAPALDVALAGPRVYHGTLEEFPFVHDSGRRDLGPRDIDAACAALWRVWWGLFALVVIVAVID